MSVILKNAPALQMRRLSHLLMMLYSIVTCELVTEVGFESGISLGHTFKHDAVELHFTNLELVKRPEGYICDEVLDLLCYKAGRGPEIVKWSRDLQRKTGWFILILMTLRGWESLASPPGPLDKACTMEFQESSLFWLFSLLLVMAWFLGLDVGRVQWVQEGD